MTQGRIEFFDRRKRYQWDVIFEKKIVNFTHSQVEKSSSALVLLPRRCRQGMGSGEQLVAILPAPNTVFRTGYSGRPIWAASCALLPLGTGRFWLQLGKKEKYQIYFKLSLSFQIDENCPPTSEKQGKKVFLALVNYNSVSSIRLLNISK